LHATYVDHPLADAPARAKRAGDRFCLRGVSVVDERLGDVSLATSVSDARLLRHERDRQLGDDGRV
jgi:hypothetical protein